MSIWQQLVLAFAGGGVPAVVAVIVAYFKLKK
jgi:hypothetical protein